VHWYNRDLDSSEAERREEIRQIKETEEDALAVALLVFLVLFDTFLFIIESPRGFKPAVRPAPGAEAGSSTVEGGEKPKSLEDSSILADKEDKRRRKEERRKRKEEKRERKELKRLRRLEDGSARGEIRRLTNKSGSDDEYDALRGRTTRSWSRSRSPRGLNWRTSGKSRSRSPDHDGYRPRGVRESEGDRYDHGIRERRSRFDASDYERSRGADRL
jgi:hypothetical protein